MTDMIHAENNRIYYQTPWYLAYLIVKAAAIEPGMYVLEPSAGEGRIADVIRRNTPQAILHLVEMDTKNCKVLQDKGYGNVSEQDFLEYYPGADFDRIVMNPPFENGTDIQHIFHAYSLLKEGGRLVAIASARSTKDIYFSDWLKENNAVVEKNPPFTFQMDGYITESVTITLDK